MLALGYGFWNFWEYFPQKVTFDGPNKIIWVNDGEIEIDVQIDLYSNWKEWVQYRDNSKYDQAFGKTGGDLTPTGAIGGTYFLENDWRIRPWAGNYLLKIIGNMYDRLGADPFVGSIGDTYKVTILQTVSNIVDTVSTDAIAVAQEVWDHSNRILTDARMGNLDVPISSRASAALLASVQTDVTFIKAIEGGRWEIFNNQMIFYDDDNATEIARFNLLDSAGDPTQREPLQRVRV